MQHGDDAALMSNTCVALQLSRAVSTSPSLQFHKRSSRRHNPGPQ